MSVHPRNEIALSPRYMLLLALARMLERVKAPKPRQMGLFEKRAEVKP